MVCIKISPFGLRVLNGANRTLGLAAQTVLEQPVVRRLPRVLRPVPAVVFEDVGITAGAVTLVVEGGGLFDGRWRGLRRSVTIIVLLELHAVVVVHSALVYRVQGTIVAHNLNIPSAAISKIVHVLRVECALQCGETLIWLYFIRMKHLCSASFLLF